MTLADSVILPFNVTHYGVNLKEYNKRIKSKFAEDFNNHNVTKELGESFKFAECFKDKREGDHLVVQQRKRSCK